MSSENGTERKAYSDQPDQFSERRDPSGFSEPREENLNGQPESEADSLVGIFKTEFSSDNYRIFERNLDDIDLLNELEQVGVLPTRDEEELRLLRDLGLRYLYVGAILGHLFPRELLGVQK